jgi:hypothetical protein
LPNTEDEWIPRELIEATPAPLFRRFAPSRSDQERHTAQPAIDPLIARRLDEVERSVAEAAAAAERSASKVKTILLG